MAELTARKMIGSSLHSNKRASDQRICTVCVFGGLLNKRPKTSQQPLEPALLSWLRQKGLPDQKVELAYFPQQGRGLQATSKIRRGERLLQIPEGLLLTPDAAIRNARLGAALEKAGLPSWTALAVALADARYVEDSSFWSPYAQALPLKTGCVLEWGPEEVELLKGSVMHREAQAILQAASTSVQELQPLIAEAEQDGMLPQGVLTEERLRWAFAMLLSRLVRLPGRQNMEALCPWADMMNHDSHSQAHLDYDPAAKAVVLQPDRDYQAGEQVFASYGQRTSGQLLLSYGFAPEPADNPHDACLIRLSLASDDPSRAAKAAALQRFGLQESQEFPLRMGALPTGVLQYAAFLEAVPGDAAEAAELADWLFERGQFPRLDGVDTELLGIEVLKEECRTVLAAFPESLETNQKTLDQLRQRLEDDEEEEGSLATTSLSRKALIYGVKLQEQKVLHRTVFALQQRRREIQ